MVADRITSAIPIASDDRGACGRSLVEHRTSRHLRVPDRGVIRPGDVRLRGAGANRPAQAQSRQEVDMASGDAGWIAVAKADDLADGIVTPVVAGPLRVLLVRSEGVIHAVADRCSHADADLDCGIVRGGWIGCPAHGARFDLETGEPLNPPATQPIRVFPSRIRDGSVEILLEPNGV